MPLRSNDVGLLSELQQLDVASPKNCAMHLLKDAWKKYEAVIKTDDENLCDLQCVRSRLFQRSYIH